MIGIDADIITQYAYQVANAFEAINTEYIELMGKHIKQIGKLTATDLHRTEQMLRVGTNSERLKEKLALEAGKSVADIDELFDKVLETSYKDSKYLYDFRFGNVSTEAQYKQLQAYAQAMKYTTEGTFKNIARTTAIKPQYQSLVDKAIIAVTEGVTDYNGVMRDALKKAAVGARVVYSSGYTRRLDSAVRMNILDGTRKLNQGLRDLEGKQFGADGIEVSAHALCAPDHLDIEGQQFTISEFERENNFLARPIGTCNCQHTYFPIILGVSKPAYSDEELSDLKHNSTQQIEIDGKTLSKYEWSQACRKLETEMRYAKDQAIIGKAAEDKILVKQAQEKLGKLNVKYKNVCEQARLTPHFDRAYVPGYTGRQVTPKPVS